MIGSLARGPRPTKVSAAIARSVSAAGPPCPISVLPGRSAPISTFSSAVIERNSRMFWNVRPSPAAVRWCGGIVVMSVPSSSDLAGGRLVEAGQHVERGGLAGAVRPDQRVNAAAPDRDIDAVDGLQAAEIFRQALDLEHDIAADAGRLQQQRGRRRRRLGRGCASDRARRR